MDKNLSPLTPEQIKILKDKGTEAPFSGKYYYLNDEGMYACAACGHALFSSAAKYNSGSGWPSFNQAISNQAVKFLPDDSYGMNRTEVLCGNCGSHLGHIFSDSTQPTGQDYCINSLALDFKPKKSKSTKTKDVA